MSIKDQVIEEDKFIEDLIESRKNSPCSNHDLEQRLEIEDTLELFVSEYPELAKEFRKITDEMYETFARKHMDYGLQNISLGGDLTKENDKKFSLTGLAIRLTDKVSRLRNLLVNGKSFVKGEGMEDTFLDVANYGIIGLLVGRDKWKK